jgi:uncharacterized protein YidB (DUF937 family)
MSLDSGILGSVVGSVFGASPRGVGHNALGEVLAGIGGGAPIHSGMLLSAALSLLQQNGGLDGVLERLRQAGFAAHADSWVGTGPNLPISPAELQQALGLSGMDRVAAPLNYSSAEAGSAMAEILPELVNQLTPEGRLPARHADLIARGITMLSNAGA